MRARWRPPPITGRCEWSSPAAASAAVPGPASLRMVAPARDPSAARAAWLPTDSGPTTGRSVAMKRAENGGNVDWPEKNMLSRPPLLAYPSGIGSRTGAQMCTAWVGYRHNSYTLNRGPTSKGSANNLNYREPVETVPAHCRRGDPTASCRGSCRVCRGRVGSSFGSKRPIYLHSVGYVGSTLIEVQIRERRGGRGPPRS